LLEGVRLARAGDLARDRLRWTAEALARFVILSRLSVPGDTGWPTRRRSREASLKGRFGNRQPRCRFLATTSAPCPNGLVRAA